MKSRENPGKKVGVQEPSFNFGEIQDKIDAEERRKIAEENGVPLGDVDKRADGCWYVKGKQIPKQKPRGLAADDEAQYRFGSK